MDSTGGRPGIWALSVIAFDTVEAPSMDFACKSMLGLTRDVVLPTGRPAIGIGYRLTHALPDGDRIGPLTFATGAIGMAPDDEVADLRMGGSMFTGTTLCDPICGLVARSNADPQPVPLPVPALLLAGGLGALAALRRRTA
ncbi:hypothetical protein [Mangrovicoccus ximenensis]|uniref:hypothetical protein n=1 Tax=Mangrovicoccus ximenensis TaxID=1911570 RepID=UPI000D3ABEBC|nr:hypothetical protein [Mangrovicoccus ximenensis]